MSKINQLNIMITYYDSTKVKRVLEAREQKINKQYKFLIQKESNNQRRRKAA